ncbi:MAG TPA: L-threonine 3-dehydrogenase [Phycisphaerae bacterium]|nr:L-threonine 3-dehydrogenase [Phycisphaerae bacterium]
MSGSATLPTTMACLRKPRAAPGLDYEDSAPLPQLGPRDVLIKVRKAGICGTDRGIYEWGPWAQSRIKVGIIIGHEVMGTVVAVGNAVEAIQPGQRVSVEGHIGCGSCFSCKTGNAHVCDHVRIIGIDRDGSFAQYLAVPYRNVWPLDPQIPDDVAAIMDPLGNAVHTVMTAGVSGKSVLITGAGMIGLMAVTVAKAAGVGRLIVADINDRNLALAKELGADHTLKTTQAGWIEEAKKLTRGLGPDVVCEMSGATKAINGGLAALRNCGTMAILGLPKEDVPINFNDHVIFKGARIIGINGRRMFETWYQMEDLILSGRVRLDPIITHRIPLKDFERGFKLMQAGEAIKVILNIEDGR